MHFFTSLQHQVDALQRIVGGDSATGSIPERLHQLNDHDLQDALNVAASIQRQAERLRLASNSVLSQRSHMTAHA